MPIKYVCKNCGYILYQFDHVGQDTLGVRTPSELKVIFAGECPRCGHPLGTPKVEDINIRLNSNKPRWD